MRNRMTEIECQDKLANVLSVLCKQYNVREPDSFALCGRLKTSAGFFKVNDRYPNGRITVAKNYFKLNGYQECESTLRHEFTHHYLYQKNTHISGFSRRCGHTAEFKEFCSSIGGTMNSTMVGTQYASHACDNYVRSAFKWKYVCCGKLITKTKRAYSIKELNKYCCSSCSTTMNNNMKVRI